MKINFQNMCSLRKISCGLIFSMAISLVACDSDNDEEGGDNGDDGLVEDTSIPGNSIVTVKQNRNIILHNPLSGWVLYAGIGDGLSSTFWQDYDNFPSSEGTVKVSDYANTLYLRGAWADFNPEEGKYAWNSDCDTPSAKRLKMLIEGAKQRNMKLAFTFVVDSRDKHYNFTPNFVKEAGAKGYETQTGSVKVWSPYPDDPIFQKYYEKFIRALAKDFNDPDKVQFVSGSGFGKWGEYHSVWYYQVRELGKPELPTREAVFDWVTDLYSQVFDKVPVFVNYHRWIGTSKEWDGNNYDKDTERLIGKAVAKGYSLRHDAFGMKTYYSTWERNFIAKWKYLVPVVMEGGWVKNSHGNSIQGDGYANYAEVRQGEFDEAKTACVNMMDLRYNSDFHNGEAYSWFNEAFQLVKQFCTEGSYRLFPDRISLPTTISNGKQIEIAHRWNNFGWGYCPTNIPQWKNKYKVAFALLDTKNDKPKYVFVDGEPEACDWVKGAAKSYTFTTRVEGVEAGKYMWAVGIVDTAKQNEIGIHLAVKNNVTSAGWLKLFEVIAR